MRRHRLVLAVNLALALAIGAFVWTRVQPRLQTDLRRDLLLDASRVELLEGFDDIEHLFVQGDDKRTNPDRTEVPLPVRRDCRLIWHVEARPGRFVCRVARLQMQLGADDSPCRVRVSIVGSSAPPVEVQVPPCAADAGDSTVERSDPANIATLKWREGPSVPLQLELPEGAAALQIEVVSEGAPADGALALLSPHVTMTPLSVQAEELLATVPLERRLMADVAREAAGAAPRVRLGSRRALEAGAEVGETLAIEVGALEAVGSFAGKGGAGVDERPALAFTGAASREFVVDLAPDTRLTGALALDARMPPGTSAALEVAVDGARVALLPVGGRRWEQVEVPLGSHAGAGRRLRLALVEPQLVTTPITVQEFDFAAQVMRLWHITPEQVRLAISDPLLVRTTTVPRRLASAGRPSVILIQFETLRADVLPLYGGATAGLAPTFDALAASSVVFEQAMTPSSWTVPTTSTLMLGLPPTAHGAVDIDSMVLPGDKPTLAELARRAGIATGAVVANELLRPAAGYARGFESYARVPYSNARQMNDLAAAFLENHGGQQFLLYLHYFDPHGPCNAPGEWRDRYVEPELRQLVVREAETRLRDTLLAHMAGLGPAPGLDDPDVRFLRGRYLGEVAYLDHLLAELFAGLKRLGRDRDTVVVLTSDHGEEFMEHGLYGHGSQLFDETLHVPLLIRAPEDMPLPWRPGARVPDLVSTASLYASVLTWLGVPFDASECLPGLEQRVSHAVSETNKGVVNDKRDDPLRRYVTSVRTSEWRLIAPQKVEGEPGAHEQSYYDLRVDPECLRPLTGAAAPEAAVRHSLLELLSEYLNWAQEHRGAAPLPGGAEGTFDMLKQMGYTR